ncbi:odorant receptor 13a-like [Prorops nasuta]|uniref:odorant receptor 13a-like n=1 Tax=Prorops nasuta TaxID=863751 RepID=UPI0034CE4877
MGKEDFYDLPYYNVTKRLLLFTGTWPYQPRLIKVLIVAFISLGEISFSLGQLIKAYEVRNNLDLIFETISPPLSVYLIMSKFFNGVINEKKIKKLFEKVRQDFEECTDEEELDIYKEFALRGRKMALIYFYSIGTIVTAFCTMACISPVLDLIMPLNESRPRRNNFEAELFIDQDKYFFSIWIWSSFLIDLIGFILCAFDILYLTQSNHCCSKFGAVENRLIRTFNKTYVNLNDVEVNDIIYEEFKTCIRMHQDALKFVKQIDDAFSSSLFFQLTSNLVILSITGVQVIVNIDKPGDVIRFGGFAIGQIIHLFFINLPGQYIQDHSDRILDFVCELEWYNTSQNTKNLLQIFIMRCQKVCQLTAGKLVVMSMFTFSSFLQTSISYFTVLSSLR